jgi:hypothetical protein
MSAEDKAKLDSISVGANKTTVTSSGNGNAVTSLSESNGEITYTLGKTFSESDHIHNDLAPLDSPNLTGTPTLLNTPIVTDSSKKIATTEYVNTRLSVSIGKVAVLNSDSEGNLEIDPSAGNLFKLIIDKNTKVSISELSSTYYNNEGTVITLYANSGDYVIAWDNKISWFD